MQCSTAWLHLVYRPVGVLAGLLFVLPKRAGSGLRIGPASDGGRGTVAPRTIRWPGSSANETNETDRLWWWLGGAAAPHTQPYRLTSSPPPPLRNLPLAYASLHGRGPEPPGVKSRPAPRAVLPPARQAPQGLRWAGTNQGSTCPCASLPAEGEVLAGCTGVFCPRTHASGEAQ